MTVIDKNVAIIKCCEISTKGQKVMHTLLSQTGTSEESAADGRRECITRRLNSSARIWKKKDKCENFVERKRGTHQIVMQATSANYLTDLREGTTERVKSNNKRPKVERGG